MGYLLAVGCRLSAESETRYGQTGKYTRVAAAASRELKPSFSLGWAAEGSRPDVERG